MPPFQHTNPDSQKQMELIVPDLVESVLLDRAALLVSVSGGKDSRALALALGRARARRGWNGPVEAQHARLGGADWPETRAEAERTAREAGFPLTEVWRPQGDLVEQIEGRALALLGTGRSPWPSSTSRYCTSDQKAAQLDKNARKYELLVNARGVRAEESPARSREAVLSLNTRITAKRLRDLSPEEAVAARRAGERVALVWNAIHDWTEADVWACCGTSREDLERRRRLFAAGLEAEALDGWSSHPCYVWGLDRMACALCIFGNARALAIGAARRPDLLDRYVRVERLSGKTFKKGFALAPLGRTTPEQAD